MLETSEHTAQRIETVNRPFVSADSIVVHCKMGGRSAKAVKFLHEVGFRKVVNLAGGIKAWAEALIPAFPRIETGQKMNAMGKTRKTKKRLLPKTRTNRTQTRNSKDRPEPQVPSDQTDLDLWEDQGGAAR